MKNLLQWAVFLTGFASLCIGVGMVSIPLGLMTAGVLVMTFMLMSAIGKEMIEKEEKLKK